MSDTLPGGKVSRPTKALGLYDWGFTGIVVCAHLNPDMFHHPITPVPPSASDMASLLDLLAEISSRPRYAFMVLNLIAEVAGPDGKAGPFIVREGGSLPLRDWLGQSLTPMGGRDPRRLALAERVREELALDGTLPADPALAKAHVAAEVRHRVLASGKTNLSRAVSELVRGGLLRRHYAGDYVDHHNRGGQRHVVYTVVGRARCLLARSASPPARDRRQGELALN